MVKLLIYIKHHLIFIWDIIEWFNSIIFYLLYHKKLKESLKIVENTKVNNINFKVLKKKDMYNLCEFFNNQPEDSFIFFKPHNFDVKSLIKTNRNKAFLMIGCFEENEMVGYCFLRFFCNKHSFRGKIVDRKHQGKGIAKEMGRITTNIAKNIGFRLFATISKDNIKSIASSKAVNKIKIIRELPNNYIYVEYL